MIGVSGVLANGLEIKKHGVFFCLLEFRGCVRLAIISYNKSKSDFTIKNFALKMKNNREAVIDLLVLLGCLIHEDLTPTTTKFLGLK